MQLHWLAALWLLLLQSSMFAVGERTRDKMYEPVNGYSCFRRLNGTHQTGCSSSQSGSVGVLHLVRIEEDIDFLVNGPPAPPYAPLIPPHLFTRKNILRLRDEARKNISVILLINESGQMSNFSHELNCPNQYSGILASYSKNSNGSSSKETATCDANNPDTFWNPWGTGLLHEDFPFPIYYISESDEIKKLINCFETFNNFDYSSHSKRRLCAVEVNTFMSAAVSSEVCIRRTNFANNLARTRYCDPLEGRNVYASLFPRQISDQSSEVRNPNVNERLILITSRLDTTSMFDGVGVGALDSLMGYATLVNVGHMLSLILPKQIALPDKNLNVLFVLFNGESYDYIGSQRFVYDLEHLNFPTRSTQTAPISFDNIEFILDLGTLDEITNIKLHTLSEFPQSKLLLDKLNKYGSTPSFDFKINFETAVGFQVPPTSAQSFLRKNISFPAAILNASPKNRYYHSIYDDFANVDFKYGNHSLDYTALLEAQDAFKYFAANSIQMKVRNISSVIAMTLYETLMGSPYPGSKIVNPLLVDELLFCFLHSADCPLFKAASHPNSLPGLAIPPMRYISVAGGPQESSGWTYRIMGYLLSQKVDNVKKENCSHLPLHWFAGYDNKGECRYTTQNYSFALSPAFLIEDYDWKSGEYSTWTESTWLQLSARMFLRPSKTHEVVTLCIGVVVLIFSFCLIYIISSRSDVLFENGAVSTDALTEPTAC